MIENSSPGLTEKLTSVSARTPPNRSEIRSAASNGAGVAVIGRRSFPIAAGNRRPIPRYTIGLQVDKQNPAR
jgi:hypothetical protein